jgi:hypothetical protein
MIRTAGKATSKKRKHPKSIGGIPFSPNLITVKLTPQTMTTVRARKRSRSEIIRYYSRLFLGSVLLSKLCHHIYWPHNSTDSVTLRMTHHFADALNTAN